MTAEESTKLYAEAATVFRPRTPVNTHALFAGRWEQIRSVTDAISQSGLHVVLYGERGVGKSSLANIVAPLLEVITQKKDRLVVKVNTNASDTFSKLWARAFQEVSWAEEKATLGFAPGASKKRVTLLDAFGLTRDLDIDDVRRVLNSLPGSVFIFDEFDRGPSVFGSSFTDLIKTLSDYSVDSTVILVGVAETIDDLVKDHASIKRSIVQIHLPRMKDEELAEILKKASEKLNISFTDSSVQLIVSTSQGLPNYTHLLGLYSSRAAINSLTRTVTVDHVTKSFDECIAVALQTTQDLYLKSTQSAHKDALFKDVILACAFAARLGGHPHGEFYPSEVVGPLSKILKRDHVTIATFQGHIAEFCEEGRGPILVRLGSPRNYRYRFSEPLLPPFIFMASLKDGRLTPESLRKIQADLEQ